MTNNSIASDPHDTPTTLSALAEHASAYGKRLSERALPAVVVESERRARSSERFGQPSGTCAKRAV